MASKDGKSIIIPALEVVRLNVRIEGITPLICHRFSEAAQRVIEQSQQGAAKTKKAPRVPEDEFQASLYRTPDDGYGFPAIGVKKAMVSAGQRFAGERSTELFGAFSIPVELLEIESDAEPRMRSDRVVLSGIGRVSSIAYRAEFLPWAMNIPITLMANFISPDQIVNLLRLAGYSVGIGDWRVEKKGSFGQWNVANVEAMPQ